LTADPIDAQKAPNAESILAAVGATRAIPVPVTNEARSALYVAIFPLPVVSPE
jgi:hypothetical protein